ncbi:type II toxin-antitoxin system HicA family toxin [Rathayibacter sp. VKM Ac-2760]|uniref:type II toxin-antitoxin system HicA family toxin n=1 Tax=Rathayibacter sp. VKM Ac-2760 TaxID=2609253 RepID=UPI001ABE795A|nr:type II toxin-antitoxin system HicA family toxin [Rathayibacter sp. VKM Ac-2760]
MVKPMRYRELVALLRAAGFTSREGKGDHEVWSCNGKHHVVLTQTRDVSPGLVRKALNAIEAAKEDER